MKRYIQKKHRSHKSEAGFTLLEMVIVMALVSIFFTATASLVPFWYRAYEKTININYARQIANNAMGAVEQQIRFGNDLEVLQMEDSVERITGTGPNGRFYIPMKESTNLIEGLVYDKDFFKRNDITLSFSINPQQTHCTVNIKVWNRGEKILEKSRAVPLAGEND